MRKIVIASIKSWNIALFESFQEKYKKEVCVYLIKSKAELTKEYLKERKPEFVFFIHWSWMIPEEIYEEYSCVVFHTAKLPQFRGGSPIQHQILNGVYDTEICAIQVSGVLDGGDVYCRESCSIKDGTIDDILMKISETIFNKMIPQFLEHDIRPMPQHGEIKKYIRRKPEQSALETISPTALREIYDFIRMLDGEGYPKAFMCLNNKYKITFSKAKLGDSSIIGAFEIYEK